MMAVRQLALCAALAVLLVACASKARAPTPTSTTGTPAATATTPATRSTVNPNATLVVYLIGGNLWIASLDGTTAPPRAITSNPGGSPSAGFAGYVRKPDGGIDLYYVDELAQLPNAPIAPANAEFGLYRLPLEGRAAQELLRYQSEPLQPSGPSNAIVSPNGKSVLYAGDGGLNLLDIASGHTRNLFENSPPCRSPANCFRYVNPIWSPASDRALITKALWEGGGDWIVDPFSDPPTLVQTPGGGGFASRWSPDAQQVCESESSYGSAGAMLVYDVSSGRADDATLQLGVPTPAEEGRLRIDTFGCAWLSDDKLAFAYVVPDNYSDVRIAVVDGTYSVIKQSDLIDNLIEVVCWLPDGSGIIFNRALTDTGASRPPGIYELDGTVDNLPFAADAVVAVIPPTPSAAGTAWGGG